SIGIIECLTQKEVAEIDREGERRNETVEPFTSFFASRVQKDMNNSNTRLGGIFTATNRDLPGSVLTDNFLASAYTGGLDFNHQWKNKTYYINLSGAFSHLAGSETAINNLQTSAPHFSPETK
ncbi:MAG: hydrolase, partial [Bacteroidales bacterium]|nr:hydrolase [Bacteroidales bacterium]